MQNYIFFDPQVTKQAKKTTDAESSSGISESEDDEDENEEEDKKKASQTASSKEKEKKVEKTGELWLYDLVMTLRQHLKKDKNSVPRLYTLYCNYCATVLDILSKQFISSNTKCRK